MQLYRAAEREPRQHPPVARAVLTVQSASRGGPAGTVVLLHQVLRLTQTIQRGHETAGRVSQARAAAHAGVHVRAAANALDPSVVIAGDGGPRLALAPRSPVRGQSATVLPGMNPGTTTDWGIGR